MFSLDSLLLVTRSIVWLEFEWRDVFRRAPRCRRDYRKKAAHADPNAQPLTESDLKRMKRTPRAKIIRRALELTQEEFAMRFHIPLGTLQDWEQGSAEPDQPARAYLTVIARDIRTLE